jgi:hypothetical protein
MSYNTIQEEETIKIYIALCERKKALLEIIGDTKMWKYSIKTMKPQELAFIYEMLANPLLEGSALYFANYNLKIWKKHYANLELTFLNAQIQYIRRYMNTLNKDLEFMIETGWYGGSNIIDTIENTK